MYYSIIIRLILAVTMISIMPCPLLLSQDNRDNHMTKADKDDKDRDDKDNKDDDEPPKIGNFSLPLSQQPAALFGFGGNIINAGELQFYCFADAFIGNQRIVSDVIPSLLYGITDNFSILFNAPFTPIMRDGDNSSSGLEDAFIQLEYAFYNHSTPTYTDQATIVFNVSGPTGSTKVFPPTGFGAPTFFLGTTYYRTFVDWMWFTSHGAILPTSRHGTQFGDQFLYQFGIEKYIPSPHGWIYACMLELDGQYNKKNRIEYLLDPNSGGNIIAMTPSIWISSKRFLLQLGISLPVSQHLAGNQRKYRYGINLNLGLSLY